MTELNHLRGVADRDRKMIEEAQSLMGPEPGKMGFIKNLFWGRVREELLFPWQSPTSEEEENRCEKLLAALDEYLEREHPATRIDQEQEIPGWVIERLFAMGVMGMTIPREYGGGGFGITSYNWVLERIGRNCGSTAVMVSAHQSIGCRAIVLYGTNEQKSRWLPHLAREWVSAFCLSEPNVGCDAGGQETHCELSRDGEFYILNGEKKWATSGAFAQVFTIMAKLDGKVTAFICTPDMPGIEIYQKNRSKCGVRGTWQARIRFHDVHIPKSHLLHVEGRGLQVALSCLDYGRCTLSAGMLGGARRAFEQAGKWAQTRYQFQRPLADFELVREKLARMAALNYAMEAMLYQTCAMLDRHDSDVMVETAVCKMWCSEMGWRVVNDAMQIMGGEGYMTENQVERIFRDSRINLIVEGANEVMQSFVFAYGGKQLAERLMRMRWDARIGVAGNLRRMWRAGAVRMGMEVYLGIERRQPVIQDIHPSLRKWADRFCGMVKKHSHQFVRAAKVYGEKLVTRQLVQARLADSAMWLHAWACTLSKLDDEMRRGDPERRAAAEYLMEMAEMNVRTCDAAIFRHNDEAAESAAEETVRFIDSLPNDRFFIPEASPVARGTGRRVGQDGIPQFPGTNREVNDVVQDRLSMRR